MGRRGAAWTWSKVSVIHAAGAACDGEIRSYRNRYYYLPAPEREKVTRSEVKLLDHLDHLARRGDW